MRRVICLIALLLLPAIINASASQDDLIASTKIGSAASPDTSLNECFVALDTNVCPHHSSDDLILNWWSWSDETNSDWPDDDAKARAGELLINISENTPTLITNEEISSEQAISNRDMLVNELPIISLTGELDVYAESDGHRIDIPVVMTPMKNLSDSTIMYIYLSKDYSIDHHNRKLSKLIYEMKPEIGFSIQADNSTETTWQLAESHLSAAGVDFTQDPHGWSVTFALFGSLENESTNQLLYLNQVKLVTQSDRVELDQFLVPMFAVIFAIIVIATILGNMHKEEHGMPIISGYWHRTKTNCLVVEFTTKNRRMEIKSLEVDKPWKLSSRFKSRFIEPNKSIDIELKFKQSEPTDCRLNIRLEVEELGVWTQFLSISSNAD